jgi:hypothetical protein
MGKIGNTFQRFRNKFPKMDFANHKHGECANFDNGTCVAAPRIFKLTNLNPKGPACPHFKARNKQEFEGK